MEKTSQIITSSLSSSILPSSLPESSQYSVYLFATADSLLLSVSIVFAKSFLLNPEIIRDPPDRIAKSARIYRSVPGSLDIIQTGR